MTMVKLAKLAGVSVSTVSKAFSGSKEISEDKRKYIFEVAKEAGCYDKYCKNIRTEKVIAVICPEFNSRFYSEQLSILEKEIRKRGAVMITGCSDFNKEKCERLLSLYTEQLKVSGIILLHNINSNNKHSVPIVVIGKSDKFDSITISETNALKEAITHLKENGHKNIAFIGESLTSGRRDEFEKALISNKLNVNKDYIIEDAGRFELAGYNAMNNLLKLENRPTAVICAYDNIAIGAMRSIYEHGLKIPDDISIIGSDDINESPYLSVPLTSITAYNEDLCEILVDMLFERIDNPRKNNKKSIKVSKELIKRDSVGKSVK